jgi:two-component system, OmpR family, phosphate regulon sensor histidine kinase PhoR
MAILALAGVVVTQIYWVTKAYSIEEKQFNDRVVIAMTQVVDRIQTMNKDSSIVEPVQQVSSNFYVANINDTLHPYLLETLLREEFAKSNLHEDFEYGIYDCFNDSIVFGSRVSFDENVVQAEQETTSIQKKFDRDGHYFGILFPQKTPVILEKMDFWIFSSILIMVIIIFFSYTISIMFKQKRLSEVKTDFINNMTHELKTPISTISISAEVLLQPGIGKDPERLERYAAIIQNENNRLKTQVDKVLQIATLNPDRVQLELRPLDLNDIVAKSVETFRVKVNEMGGEIITHLGSETMQIEGDLVHITNIVYNLLDNASKYTVEPPRIEVITTLKDQLITLSFSDNGLGIASEYRKMIFDKFYRIPTGDVHDVKGFGLGLFYVKTIVESHKGRIEVESHPGKGSVFTLTFKEANNG